MQPVFIQKLQGKQLQTLCQEQNLDSVSTEQVLIHESACRREIKQESRGKMILTPANNYFAQIHLQAGLLFLKDCLTCMLIYT